jgi:hypothetical protein
MPYFHLNGANGCGSDHNLLWLDYSLDFDIPSWHAPPPKLMFDRIAFQKAEIKKDYQEELTPLLIFRFYADLPPNVMQFMELESEHTSMFSGRLSWHGPPCACLLSRPAQPAAVPARGGRPPVALLHCGGGARGLAGGPAQRRGLAQPCQPPPRHGGRHCPAAAAGGHRRANGQGGAARGGFLGECRPLGATAPGGGSQPGAGGHGEATCSVVRCVLVMLHKNGCLTIANFDRIGTNRAEAFGQTFPQYKLRELGQRSVPPDVQIDLPAKAGPIELSNPFLSFCFIQPLAVPP